jgi:hypothetical protein
MIFRLNATLGVTPPTQSFTLPSTAATTSPHEQNTLPSAKSDAMQTPFGTSPIVTTNTGVR